MAVGPPLDTAAIISTTLEGILYGFSLLMYILTTWVLFRNKSISEVNKPMLIVASLLLIFSTIHMAVDINRIYLGFIGLRDTIPNPVLYFEDVSQQTFVFKNAVYSFQTAVGDGVVLYRAYAVWKSPYPLILPFIVYCGVLATSIGSVYTVSITSPNSSNIFFKTTGQWITAFYAATFSCNLLATITLAVRLWWIERKAASFRHGGGTLRPILLIVIDSGLLYSIALFSALMCFVNGSNAQFIVLDLITPVISISFYGVILRVALVQSDRERANTANPKISVSSASASGQFRSNNGFQSRSGFGQNSSHQISIGGNDGRYYGQRSPRSMGSGDSDGYAMKPLRVDIVREESQVVDSKPWDA